VSLIEAFDVNPVMSKYRDDARKAARQINKARRLMSRYTQQQCPVVPDQITASDWTPTLNDNEQTFSLEELAALFDACLEPKPAGDPIPPNSAYGYVAAVMRATLRHMPDQFSIDQLDAGLRARELTLEYKPLLRAITEQLSNGNMTRDPARGRYGRSVPRYRASAVIKTGLRGPRYTREHWRRFLVLAIGTASREAALRELRWDQVVLRDDPKSETRGFIRLNPEGRRQTKKRRATVPICPTLGAELASWERDNEYVISYYGNRLASREFFESLAQAAEVTGSAHVIRHTVRTWLAEVGVPDAEADVFMGHKAEGSATGKRYIHRQPGFLKSVSEGIELLFNALSEMVARPFAGHQRVDQPHPEDPVCAAPLAKCLPTLQSGRTELCNFLNLERETRLELATPTLARSCSTN
jgi:integrase